MGDPQTPSAADAPARGALPTEGGLAVHEGAGMRSLLPPVEAERTVDDWGRSERVGEAMPAFGRSKIAQRLSGLPYLRSA